MSDADTPETVDGTAADGTAADGTAADGTAVDGTDAPTGGAEAVAVAADESDGEAAAAAPARVPSPRWHPSTKIVAGVALGVAALAGIYLARNALTLVALAGLVAFLVAPMIRFLQRRARFPRVLALLTSYAVTLIGVVLVGGLIGTGIVGSLSQIDPPTAAASLRAEAVGWLSAVRTINLGGYEIDFGEAVDPMIERLENSDAFELDAVDPDGEGDTDAGGEEAIVVEDDEDGGATIIIGRRQIESVAGGLLTSVQTVGGFLVATLVTFLVAMYLSADIHSFRTGLRAHIPEEYDHDADRMSERLGEIWRGYLYGQLANSLATGLLVWLVLWAVGLPGAFVFGVIMALLNMIPTFGPIIAAVPGVLAALALGSDRLDWSAPTFALLVMAIYLVVVQVQANFMAPFITGRAVRMSPATILVGLLVGFQVGGLVGSLLVVPVLATFKEVGKYVMAKLLDRDPFAEPAEGAG